MDIVDRLRREFVWEPEVGELLDTAAREIVALRSACESLQVRLEELGRRLMLAEAKLAINAQPD